LDHPSPDTESVVELVRRAQRRDPEAFAALVGRYERMALSVAYAAIGDAHAAADAVQDGFAKAWQKLADLKEPARFGTWLCGIVRNGAIDQRRRARLAPKPVLDDMPEAAAPAAARFAGRDWADDPADQLEAREEERLVAAALDDLDEITRSAVVLRYFQGMSSKEIGQVLEMNATAVDMRLSRARQQIKQKLLTSQAFADQKSETA
jgi:RNA polymerase sigma factor (sigma-70 family)